MTGRRSHGRLSALNGVVHQGTGRALKGFVYVSRDGVRTAAALRAWVDQSVTFRTLPPK